MANTMKCEVRVLSFNIWGLHYIDSIRIKERLEYIAEELKHYDIVGLQEVWKRSDYNFLVQQLQHILPHHHYFHCGAIGSGLCVFSRHPIIHAYTRPFTICGSMQFLLDGEIFGGKGVLLCRILTPAGHLAFYNTHLDPRQRDSQMFEIYQFVEQTRGEDPVIMTGDYNTKPTHDAYKFLVSSLALEDVFSDEPVDTCDRDSNIYTKRNMSPKRIDFVFHSDKNCTMALVLKERSLALSGNIPGKDFPYSDHEGVEATFQVERRSSSEHLEVSPGPLSEEHFDDDLVHTFLQMAKNLRRKQEIYKSTPKRVIGQWIALAILALVLSIIADQFLHHLLAAWRLGWLLFLGMALVGALSVARAVTTVVNANTYLGLEACLTEIDTLLRFNTVAKVMNTSTGSSISRCSTPRKRL